MTPQQWFILTMNNSLKKRPKASDISGQKLPYPAKQSDMQPAPQSDLSQYRAAGKLEGKTALITGGDSGIGRRGGRRVRQGGS